MPKRFVKGLIFGAGFAVAFVVVLSGFFYFIFPKLIVTGVFVSEGPGMVFGPDEVDVTKRYLGTIAVYDGEFSQNSDLVLAAGPGQIVGAAYVNGKPLVGLRLRLALNGDSFSEWVATDDKGHYEIGVPYGEYRIDGYELDRAFADKVLAGMVDDPQNPHSSVAFEVEEGLPGRGLDLNFVDRVVLDMPKKTFFVGEEVIVRWQPFPGASEYSLQVIEKTDSHAVINEKWMFPWSERPVVKSPFINLGDYVPLKAGHYYRVDIDALNDGSPISSSGNRYFAFDFKVVD